MAVFMYRFTGISVTNRENMASYSRVLFTQDLRSLQNVREEFMGEGKKIKKEKKHKKQSRISIIYRSLVDQIREDKLAFTVYCICRLVIVAVLVRSVMQGQWESCFICVLASVLLLLPPFVEKKINIQLPSALEIVVFLFVICAEILGEIECFYVKYRFWDTMLHTVNGFMFAAFGFCLIDIFNRHERFRFKVSAGFLAIVAFCFSMTIGVLWEFTEFSIDHIAKIDMQKDTVVTDIYTVSLDETNSNTVVKVKNIEKTVIVSKDGTETVVNGGYLDIGIIDTMKDLFVNFIGAIIFSIIGFIYVKNRGRGLLGSMLIPEVASDTEEYTGPEEI